MSATREERPDPTGQLSSKVSSCWWGCWRVTGERENAQASEYRMVHPSTASSTATLARRMRSGRQPGVMHAQTHAKRAAKARRDDSKSTIGVPVTAVDCHRRRWADVATCGCTDGIKDDLLSALGFTRLWLKLLVWNAVHDLVDKCLSLQARQRPLQRSVWISRKPGFPKLRSHCDATTVGTSPCSAVSSTIGSDPSGTVVILPCSWKRP